MGGLRATGLSFRISPSTIPPRYLHPYPAAGNCSTLLLAYCSGTISQYFATSAGVTAGAVSCTVTGSPPIPIAIEATTNLATGPWLRLCTTNLTATSLEIHDPDTSSHPARFYRLIGP
ncbi:MAG: hypothetical protein PHR35_13580 [Kiritimatiellae bacterium]|nr:hypothetical protein [Kiritimatiellia bacterium]